MNASYCPDYLHSWHMYMGVRTEVSITNFSNVTGKMSQEWLQNKQKTITFLKSQLAMWKPLHWQRNKINLVQDVKIQGAVVYYQNPVQAILNINMETRFGLYHLSLRLKTEKPDRGWCWTCTRFQLMQP